jgi:cysteine synthase
VNNLGVDHATICAKLEFFNPAFSVKDRLVLNIIEEGERSGAPKPGSNRYRSDGRRHGHRPPPWSGPRKVSACRHDGRQLLRREAQIDAVLCAKIVLTPRALKGFGMDVKAVELAQANGWFLARQFETKANADIHPKSHFGLSEHRDRDQHKALRCAG